MFFHQQSLEGLGCFSYMIGSHQTGECIVVDPQRDVACYLEMAAAQGLKISHIIETHLHADHVSGNQELATRTGAAIYIHSAAQARYAHVPLEDGDAIIIGECVLDILHTPGHTRDSICLLVSDTSRGDQPAFVLTGDTLLIGDVGRPDLVPGQSASDMAAMLYESLHNKLLMMPDELMVYPSHGAGSLCGRNLRGGSCTTIGTERSSNEALQARSRISFVEQVVMNQPQRPANYRFIKELNVQGASLVGDEPHLRAIPPIEANQLLEQGYVLIDIRSIEEYSEGHVPGSVILPISQSHFAGRAGQLVPPGIPIMVMCGNESDAVKAVQSLARVGHDQIEGVIEGGIDAWRAAGLSVARLGLRQASPNDVARLLANPRIAQPLLIDVREPSEWMEGHLPEAIHIPLGDLEQHADELDLCRLVIAYCKGGTRSQSAALLLAQRGHQNVWNLVGGIDAWRAAGYPVIATHRVDESAAL